MRLTVNVATKLNRSHLVHGEISYILPVIGRIEVDRQAERAAGAVDGGQHRPASTARAACARRPRRI